MKTLFSSTRQKTILFVALTVVFFALFLFRAWKGGHNDFFAYYNAGSRAFHGVSPYVSEDTPYRYLPMTAFFFFPLTLFPVNLARVIFFCVNFAAVFAIYAQIYRRVGLGALLFLLALFFRFHNHDFQNMQVNPILLILFFLWWKYRRSNLLFSSLAFAVFASFKILPFALCFPLLLLKRWKEFQWIVFWTVIINFIPVFFYDHGPYIFKDWYDQAKQIPFPAVMLPNIQSLQSALWWNLQNILDLRVFAVLSPFIQLALLSAVMILSPRITENPHSTERREDWIIASTLAVTVLIAQLAWKHNYLHFLPLAFLWFREDSQFREKRTRVLCGISFFGMVALPALISSWNRGFSDRMYLMVWSGLVVILYGLIQARRTNQILPIEK